MISPQDSRYHHLVAVLRTSHASILPSPPIRRQSSSIPDQMEGLVSHTQHMGVGNEPHRTTRLCARVCMCVCARLSMCECVCICMCVRVSVCTCVCASVCVCVIGGTYVCKRHLKYSVGYSLIYTV